MAGRLSEILQREKVISVESFQRAREESRLQGGMDIACLINNDYLTEDGLIDFLKKKYNYVYFDLGKHKIENDLIKQIPAGIARRFFVVPIAKTNNILAVAMLDPVSDEVIENLKKITDYSILPFISRKKDIEKVLYYQYVSAPEFVEDKGNANIASDEKGLPLMKKFVFDNFIIGSGNSFTYAVAVAVAKFPGGKYNPLFIYSHTGLGKTHLVNAIGNHLIANNPSMKVFYINTERFVKDIVNAIKNNTVDELHSRYRENDVFLIDDIQFLIGKERAQEEFFHTFNALSQSNKQIIVTSDRPPVEFKNIEERLKTRLAGGIITDIQPPDLETRVAILKKKLSLKENKIILSDEVIFFLAQNISNSVRELEGVLNRLIAISRLTLKGGEITLVMAKELLKDILAFTETEVPEKKPEVKNNDFQVAKSFKQKIKNAKDLQEIMDIIEETVNFLVPKAVEKQNQQALDMLNEVKKLLGEKNLQEAFKLINKLQQMNL
ncbi:ATP-binding protein [bacterium]|nr:ATP-binding protein [bacterium]